MKLVRFSFKGEIKYGLLEADLVYELKNNSIFESLEKSEKFYQVSQVKLLAPCKPSKIICIGLNYKDHATEFDLEPPEEPILFLKPPTSVIGSDEEIVYPKHMTERVDYEGELAVVIKEEATGVEVQDVENIILGYTCANDITARDLQFKDAQWTRAKCFDTFLPIGPWIETEVDASDLKVTTKVNGTVRQTSSTAQMIFDVKELISYISKVMTLLPGDLIITGTPSGVGPLEIGDKVEVEIERIGVLTNTVK